MVRGVAARVRGVAAWMSILLCSSSWRARSAAGSVCSSRSSVWPGVSAGGCWSAWSGLALLWTEAEPEPEPMPEPELLSPPLLLLPCSR